MATTTIFIAPPGLGETSGCKVLAISGAINNAARLFSVAPERFEPVGTLNESGMLKTCDVGFAELKDYEPLHAGAQFQMNGKAVEVMQ